MRPHSIPLVAILITVLCTQGSTKERNHLPLPSKILTAKTVYLDNQSGEAKLGDRAFEQLKKWGRWQVVTDRKQADLILLLSTHKYNGGYVTNTTGSVDDSGNINTTSEATPVTVGYTYITVVDPATGDSLWSDSKRWGNLYTGFHSATKGLIDELMKRVTEEEGKK